MKNSLNNRLRRGLACAAAVLTALAMTACSTSSSSFSMVSKPDNTIEVKSENADPDTVHDGSIVIEEGEVLVVESAVTAGALNVKVVNAEKGENGEPDAEQEFGGTSTDEMELPSGGEYNVYCGPAVEGTTGTLKMYAKAAEGRAADTGAADQSGEMTEGEEELPVLVQIAGEIDADLEANWGKERNVTYTLEENTIYVQVWEEGTTAESVKDFDNWENFRTSFMETFDAYYAYFEANQIKDGHLYLQYVSEAQDTAFLTIVDGEVTYDVFEDGEGAGTEVAQDTESGYLMLSEEEIKPMLAEYLGCGPENLEFVDNGTYDDKEPVAIYRQVDEAGNESDIRILLFDDGSVLGYTPEETVIDVKDFFAQ